MGVAHIETHRPSRPLILIADPDVDTRFLFAYLLQMHGLQVADTNNGPDTLAAAQELSPDLIVTEIALPGLDGFALAAALRSDARTARIPIIAVTGYSRPDLSERAAKAGIVEMLRKPCLPDDLMAAVRRALGGNVVRPDPMASA